MQAVEYILDDQTINSEGRVEMDELKRKTETESGNGKAEIGNGRQKFNRLVSGQ